MLSEVRKLPRFRNFPPDLNFCVGGSGDANIGTLEYFLDGRVGKCSINIFLASYPNCEVVSAWYRLLPVS